MSNMFKHYELKTSEMQTIFVLKWVTHSEIRNWSISVTRYYVYIQIYEDLENILPKYYFEVFHNVEKFESHTVRIQVRKLYLIRGEMETSASY